MTDDRTDDGLAPVTDLFGARSRRSIRRGPDEAELRAHAEADADADADANVDLDANVDAATADADADAGAQTPAAARVRRSDESEWRPPVTGRARPTLVAVPDVGYGATADAERASVFAATDSRSTDSRSTDSRSTDTRSTGSRSTDTRSSGVRGSDAHDLDGDPNAVDAPRSPEDQAADAERIAMRTLGRRGVSVAELRTALGKHDLDESVIEHEVERLLGVGLLDDTALAIELVDRLRSRKGLGRQGLVAELSRRGVDPIAIDTALAESDADDADEESARALDLAVKRAGQLRGLDRETAERRLSGFLMRKGYGSSAVRNAVRRALDGAGPRGSVRFE